MNKHLQWVVAVFTLFNLQLSIAQNNICGTEIPSQQWEAKFQEFIQKAKDNTTANKSIETATLYTIPVIIHVIHGGQAVGTYPNLAQGQLNSQVQVLNDDYAGSGFNTSNYPATAFVNWAVNQALPAANLDGSGRVKIANCNVQFCLATTDTLGNVLAEPGIERINYISKSWSDPASMTSYTAFKALIDGTIKPQSIWNVSKYLNVWVTDENLSATGGLLGYATFPPLSTLPGLTSTGTSTTDGFWCYAKAFGSVNAFPTGTYLSGYNKGRTCTHEIGHYLGLRHIWGDGACLTDYCNDTPPAAASNAGTPTYPYHVGTCTTSPSNSPNGEMFMNFMDYVDHVAMYMFTTDQQTRIQTAMANSPYRKFLGTHGLCSVINSVATASYNVTSTLCVNTNITFTNASSGSPTPTYTWSTSGSATISPNTHAVNPTIYFATPGTYTVTLAASNNSTSVLSKTLTVLPGPTVVVANPSTVSICSTQSATFSASGANSYFWSSGDNTSTVSVSPLSNSVYSVTGTTAGCSTVKVVSVTVNFLPTITANINSGAICVGDSVNLSGGGGTTYTWQPINTSGANIKDAPIASQTYTCYGTDANGCQNTAMVSVGVSLCTGLVENKTSSFAINVFPNPTNDKVTLKINTVKNIDVFIELFDATGKSVLKQNASFTKDKTECKLNTGSLANGIYTLKAISKEGNLQTLKIIKE